LISILPFEDFVILVFSTFVCIKMSLQTRNSDLKKFPVGWYPKLPYTIRKVA